MHFLAFSTFKVYYYAPKAGAFRNVKYDVSQWETTFHNEVEFATVHRGYTSLKQIS